MLLIDTTTISKNNDIQILNYEKLFSHGLREHLSDPYSVHKYRIMVSKNLHLPIVFLSTLSVLDYSQAPESHRMVLDDNIIHERLATYVSKLKIPKNAVSRSVIGNLYHVVWSIDVRDISGFLASFTSALEVASDPAQMVAHIIVIGNCTELVRKNINCILSSIPRRPQSVKVYSHKIQILEADILNDLKLSSMTRFDYEYLIADANFVRYEIDKIIPSDIKQVIWLDADTIVRADLAYLMSEFIDQQRSSKQPLAVGFALRNNKKFYSQCCGVYTSWPSNWPRSLLEMFGGLGGRCGFNAGVMAIDLRLWRSTGLANRVQNWIDLNRKIGPLWLGATQPPLMMATRGGNFAALNNTWNIRPSKTASLYNSTHYNAQLCLPIKRPQGESKMTTSNVSRLRRSIEDYQYHVKHLPHHHIHPHNTPSKNFEAHHHQHHHAIKDDMMASISRILHFSGGIKPWNGGNETAAGYLFWGRHHITRASECVKQTFSQVQ